MNERGTTAAMLDIDPQDVEQHVDDGWSLPVHWNWDPAIFDFEMDAIYKRNWQLVCPLSALEKPGDFFAGRVGNIPVVVVRDGDGQLRGFVNICRHRGYQVAHGQGNCRALACPYHGWTYDLRGKLRGAPGANVEPGFEIGEIALPAIAVDTWAGGVMVNLDPDAGNFINAHPQLDDYARSIGFNSESFNSESTKYTLYRQHTFHVEGNWKLWWDNYTECYHCPTIHSGSFSQAFDTDPKNYTANYFDSFSSHTFKATARTDANKLHSQSWASFMLFPGINITQQDDIMHMSQSFPVGPEKTEYDFYFFAEHGADPDRVDQWYKVWFDTFQEDVDVVEVQHRVLRSGMVKHTRLMKTQEPLTAFFTRLHWDTYKSALALEP